MITNQAVKKVGVALSGGFIRAAAEIGVLEVLAENGIPINMISGNSSGAGIAGAFVSGRLEYIKRRLADTSARGYWRVIFEPTFPHKGLLKGERNRKFFEEFVGDKTFADVDKKLIITATDLRSMKQVNLADGPISRAIQAATAVPGIFVPVEMNGQILADGGSYNLIPSQPLYDAGAGYVIGIDVSQPPNGFTRFFSNFKSLLNRQQVIYQLRGDQQTSLHIFRLISRAAHLSATQVDKYYHHGYPCDVLIRPNLAGIRRWHIGSVDYCVEQGRKAALEALVKIKRDLGLVTTYD